jgi:hypothetical protein
VSEPGSMQRRSRVRCDIAPVMVIRFDTEANPHRCERSWLSLERLGREARLSILCLRLRITTMSTKWTEAIRPQKGEGAANEVSS